MIEFNGKRLCKYCFSPISDSEQHCSFCERKNNTERFPPSLEQGKVLFGKYIVGKVLGKGGFGITYLGYDIKKDSLVAIKEYFPTGISYRNSGEQKVFTASGEDQLKTYLAGADRFYNEAKLISSFNGRDGIINVTEFFKENNTVYFVMEYLSGCDLKHYLDKYGPMNESMAIHMMLEVMKSLRVLHSKNVLHRDISPDNIFVCDDGRIKLIDFGAARTITQNESQMLSVILKPGFAPVEQYSEKGAQGPWTDIYALGATLYYSLKMHTLQSSLERKSKDKTDMSGISGDLARIIRNMISVEIKDRYKNVDKISADMNSLLQKRTIKNKKNGDTPVVDKNKNEKISQENEISYDDESNKKASVKENIKRKTKKENSEAIAYKPSERRIHINSGNIANDKKTDNKKLLMILAVLCVLVLVLIVLAVAYFVTDGFSSYSYVSVGVPTPGRPIGQ